MKQTKKLTLSAMIVALGTVFMKLGSIIEVFDLTAAALASMLVAFVYVEIGSPYTWLVWLATSFLTFILPPTASVGVMYLLLFGIYPILKGYIEKLPKIFWWPIKIVFGNISLALMVLMLQMMGMPFVNAGDTLFGITGKYLYLITWILFNIAMVLYDFFIVVMVRYYLEKLRPRFKNLLK